MEVGKKEELLVGKIMLYKIGIWAWLEYPQLGTKDSNTFLIFLMCEALILENLVSIVVGCVCVGSWQVTIHTKNYHSLTIFNTYPSFMHHGGNLESNFD